MDEKRLAGMISRIRLKDKCGNYDEEYCLDLLEVVLARNVVPQDLDEIAELLSENLKRDPARWHAHIVASEQDALAWKTVKSLVRKVRRQQPGSLAVSTERDADWVAALEQLINWALDCFEGIRSEPRTRGPDRRSNLMRNVAIAVTVNYIRNLGNRPATSNKPGRSACHVVAARLNLSYEAVRTIWRNSQPWLGRAAERGLLPFEGKR